MDPQFKTSFIPNKPEVRPDVRRKRGGPVSLVFILTLIVFIVSLAATVGVFAFQQILSDSIARKSTQLEEARSVFEEDLFREIVAFDERIQAADRLLDRHLATSRFFEFLERNTLQAVQFTSFQYEALPDGTVAVLMEGLAQGFATVALQANVFDQSLVLRDAVFADLNVNEVGDVVFAVSANVDPATLRYRMNTEVPADTAAPADEATDGSGGGDESEITESIEAKEEEEGTTSSATSSSEAAETI